MPGQLGDALDVLLASSKASSLALLSLAISPAHLLSQDRKSALLNIYTTTVLGARTPVPQHVLDALTVFVRTLDGADLDVVLGAADKSLLRSREVALDGTPFASATRSAF